MAACAIAGGRDEISRSDRTPHAGSHETLLQPFNGSGIIKPAIHIQPIRGIRTAMTQELPKSNPRSQAALLLQRAIESQCDVFCFFAAIYHRTRRLGSVFSMKRVFSLAVYNALWIAERRIFIFVIAWFANRRRHYLLSRIPFLSAGRAALRTAAVMEAPCFRPAGLHRVPAVHLDIHLDQVEYRHHQPLCARSRLQMMIDRFLHGGVSALAGFCIRYSAIRSPRQRSR